MTSTADITNDKSSDEYRWNLLQLKAMQMRVGKAFALFRSVGIEPILIKGWAAALIYPDGHFRLSSDTDLAVSETDFNQAKIVATSHEATGLAIDLHKELRHLDNVDWQDLFDNSILVPTESGDIRILRPEDHLRILCIHWLTDGGSNRERLWDIFYAIDRREGDFDWTRFLDIVGPRRRRWLVCTVGIAHKYLDLDLSDTPIAREALDLPNWFVKTIESEWSAKVKAEPLENTIHDRKAFTEQFLRRLRPNPIWATVQMEGSFDARTRFFYKIGNTLSRIVPSYRRVSNTIRRRRNENS